MLRSLGIATALTAVIVLVGCSSESDSDDSTTTSSAATETTAAPTTTATGAASTTTETTTPPETTAAAETTTTTAASEPAASDLELAGDWFACEFVEVPGEAPTDGCATFDDDGLRFAEGGELSMIERVGGDEQDCLFGNPGACFSADLAGIEIEAGLVGTWTLNGTTISVATAGCQGTVEWEPGETQSVFRPGEANGCEVLQIDANAFDQAQAGGVYFGRYATG